MVCRFVLVYFDSLNLAYYENKLYKTLDYWSKDMLNFHLLEKGLGIVSPPHFVFDFPRKTFLMIYFINWPNFIVWLLFLIEILVNMCMIIFCFPGCNVMSFEINLIFLIKPFLYMTKKWTKFLNILRKKRTLKWSKSKKHFSLFLKGFHWRKIASDLRVRL